MVMRMIFYRQKEKTTNYTTVWKQLTVRSKNAVNTSLESSYFSIQTTLLQDFLNSWFLLSFFLLKQLKQYPYFMVIDL